MGPPTPLRRSATLSANPPRRSREWLAHCALYAAVVGLSAALSAIPAAAQVLEIKDDGQVVNYSGPAIYTEADVRPIALPARPGAEVGRLLADAAARHDLPLSVVEAVAWQESRFDSRVTSPKGAVGVMQLMPQTARELGVDPADLQGNINGGAAYLSRQLRRFGDLRLALAAYNAGPQAVARYGGVPPFAETQNYVRSILARMTSVVAVGASP